MKKALFLGILGSTFAVSSFANVVWSPVGSNTVVGSNGSSYTQMGNTIKNNNTGETV